MANIAPGLNFRIGADVKGINKAIKEAEKSLRGAVSSFSSIGNSLSLALSAPIAAFGAMSIKAAGDMESLRFALEGTMKDAGRSVGEARAELEALRKAALAPGLDFEQAVKGSVRLQSVGKSAEEAREIIVQLANALALSGGTADQLDGVTRQFTQMIGKGKILQEDLSIILENMPSLAKVMQQEFGGATAAALNEAGVSVDQFISRLTKGMQELPRAQGGIANAIVNAQNAIRQSLASLGEEINKTFNVSGALNDFSNWVAGLAEWFKGLDDETKRVIGKIAIFTATLGPALLVTGKLASLFGGLYLNLMSLSKGFATTGTVLGAFSKQWAALNVVTKASIFGAIAAAVLAAAAAFAVLKKDTSEAAEKQREINAAMREVSQEVGQETAALHRNFAILKDVNASQDDRRKAVKALQDQYPDYLGNMDLEKASLGQLDLLQNRVNQSILQSVAARKQAILVDEQHSKIVDAKIRLQELEKKGFDALTGDEVSRAGYSLFGTEFEKGFVMAEARTKVVAAAMQALRGDIKSAESAVDQINASFRETFQAGESVVGTDAWDVYYNGVKKATEENKKNDASAKDLTASYKKMAKEVKIAQFDLAPSGSDLQKPVSPIFDSQGLADAAVSASTVGATIVAALTPAHAAMKALTDQTMTFQEVFEAVQNSVMANSNLMGQVIFSAASAMSQAAEQGAASFKALAVAAVQAAAKIIRSYIQQGVAAAVAKALGGVPFPFNIAAGAAAGATTAALFNSLIKKIGIPQLAEGGVLTGPQLVMAGEYPGARVNPEIVTPENKMRDVFGEVMAKNGGAGNMVLTTRISGDDLLFVLEKATAKAGRKR